MEEPCRASWEPWGPFSQVQEGSAKLPNGIPEEAAGAPRSKFNTLCCIWNGCIRSQLGDMAVGNASRSLKVPRAYISLTLSDMVAGKDHPSLSSDALVKTAAEDSQQDYG